VQDCAAEAAAINAALRKDKGRDREKRS